MSKSKTTLLWDEYLRCRDYFRYIDYYNTTNEAFRFYEGDQWQGIRTYGERCASLNILKPIVDYKVSTVALNTVCLYYSPLNYGSGYETMAQICEKLNAHAAKLWEKLKMDKLIWDIIQDAAICGDGFLYFYDEDKSITAENISNVRVLFADETLSDIQKQPYILIEQRMDTDSAKNLARQNGIPKEEYALIAPDEDEALRSEMQGYLSINKNKCTVVTKFYKKDGGVYIEKAAKNSAVMRAYRIDGLTLYPIAHYCWNRQKDRSRGIGEVSLRVANQIEINKGLVRLLSGIKQYAYPHIVYDSSVISKDNVEKLAKVGTNIGLMSNKMERVSDVISYLQPAQINAMASDIVFSLASQTRDLAGAGEAAMGQINPENASGAAIIAVKDAAAQSLNVQVASLKDFAEDIARIWYDIWTAYNPSGLSVAVEDDSGSITEQIIPSEILKEMKIDVKIDISPANSFSKYAQEQSLENLFTSGAITFEEYATSLDDDAAAPKAKLMGILEQRAVSREANIEADNEKRNVTDAAEQL